MTVIITQEVRRMLPQLKVHPPFSRLDTSSEALGSATTRKTSGSFSKVLAML